MESYHIKGKGKLAISDKAKRKAITEKKQMEISYDNFTK